MLYKKYLLLTGLCFCSWGKMQAQGVIKGFESGEIITIAEAYRQVPDLSFNVDFTYADSAYADSIIEEIPGSYKIHNGHYWTMIDSTEILQGGSYNIAVLHYDSIITVSNIPRYTNVLRLPFLDSLFLAANVDSMNVTDLTDSSRELRMDFDSLSPYRSFLMYYNRNSYLLDSILYFTRSPNLYSDPLNPGCDPFIGCPDTTTTAAIIKIVFSNYSYQVVDDSYFQESKFIYTVSDKVYLKPDYANFQLMVNTSN